MKRSGSAFRLYWNTNYGQSSLLGAFRSEEKAAFDKIAKVRMAPDLGTLMEQMLPNAGCNGAE